MTEEYLRALLQAFRQNEIGEEQVLTSLKLLPYENLEFARIDHHRDIRTGFPEVIYGEQKSAEQIIGIAEKVLARGGHLLATRVAADKANMILGKIPALIHDPVARTISTPVESVMLRRDVRVAVVTAGTGDIPVAEEAIVTLNHLHIPATRVYDAGVSGLHRITSSLPELENSNCVIVAAGMEGALPSVVAGLTGAPVIAVPTSVGYGASFQGLAALLGMLNSCASGVLVTNIDNGFGAAFAAARMLRRSERADSKKKSS